MLRITTQKEAEKIHLLVEGKLVNGWVDVLERCWNENQQHPGSPEIHVEFTDVIFINADGKNLLKRMAAAGVELTARDIHMKAILHQIRTEVGQG